MYNKKYKYYHLVDEFPWPFLVSTVSLFLTLGAVLFFHFFVQGQGFCSSNQEFVVSVVSFMSLAQKAQPKILYLGGSILANQAYSQYRSYSFRPIGIGNAYWNPTNYSVETQSIINNFLHFLQINDKEAAYVVMYAVLGNKNGLFSQNYGKVTSILNNMIFFYNKNNPSNQLTEREFLDYFDFSYSKFDLNFLDKTNRGTVMSNISEILAPQIVMNDKKNSLIERCFLAENKINISGQGNPEYTVGLFVDEENSNKYSLIVYDTDLKITEENSFEIKTNDLILSKSDLGINIYIMASKQKQDAAIILNELQVEFVVNTLIQLAAKYPNQYKHFDKNSINFKQFIETGDISFLNKSNCPTILMYRPIEYYKLQHNKTKFQNSKAYEVIMKQNSQRENVNNKADLLQSNQKSSTDDDIDN